MNLPEGPIHAGVGRQVTTGQHHQTAKRQPAREQAAAAEPGEFRFDLIQGDRRLWVQLTLTAHGAGSSDSAGTGATMATSVLGKIATRVRWMTRNSRRPIMAARWMLRARGKPPNRSVSQPSCTGFQIAKPVAIWMPSRPITPT